MATEHLRWCPTSYVVKELQTKMTAKQQCAPVRKVAAQNTGRTECGRSGAAGALTPAGGVQTGTATSWDRLAVS